MVSAPWTNFVHIKQVKQWPELGHFTLYIKIIIVQCIIGIHVIRKNITFCADLVVKIN